MVLAFQNGLRCFYISITSEIMILFVNPLKLLKIEYTLQQNTKPPAMSNG